MCERNEESPTRLGSRMAGRFRGVGLDREILEFHGLVVPANFDDPLPESESLPGKVTHE